MHTYSTVIHSHLLSCCGAAEAWTGEGKGATDIPANLQHKFTVYKGVEREVNSGCCQNFARNTCIFSKPTNQIHENFRQTRPPSALFMRHRCNFEKLEIVEKMRGVYLSYVPASTEGGKRKLVARIEDHVSVSTGLYTEPHSSSSQHSSVCMDHVITFQVMPPPLEPNDVIVQIKACGLSRIDTKVCRVKSRL